LFCSLVVLFYTTSKQKWIYTWLLNWHSYLF